MPFETTPGLSAVLNDDGCVAAPRRCYGIASSPRLALVAQSSPGPPMYFRRSAVGAAIRFCRGGVFGGSSSGLVFPAVLVSFALSASLRSHALYLVSAGLVVRRCAPPGFLAIASVTRGYDPLSSGFGCSGLVFRRCFFLCPLCLFAVPFALSASLRFRVLKRSRRVWLFGVVPPGFLATASVTRGYDPLSSGFGFLRLRSRRVLFHDGFLGFSAVFFLCPLCLFAVPSALSASLRFPRYSPLFNHCFISAWALSTTGSNSMNLVADVDSSSMRRRKWF